MLDEIEKDQSILICRKALNKWGYAMQKVVAMEECTELIEALESSRSTEFHNVEEETADVEIMCLQLGIIYGALEVYEEKTAMIKNPIDDLESTAIIACSNLIKSISKQIREKPSRIHERIAWMEIVCQRLRNKFGEDKIDEFKQAKLKRLKELVW